MKKTTIILALLVMSAGCRTTRPIVAAPTVAPAVPDSIKWVRTSAEFIAALQQVYREAGARVDEEAGKHTAGTWAVVLDADETILDNSLYQQERAMQGLGYSEASWDVWVRRREATPLPGASDFLSHVHQRGGRIAIVTNRLDSQCADTAAVFARYRLVYDAMLCRADGSTSDKNPRFQAVANGLTAAGNSPLDIVAFIGDNILDFPNESQQIRTQGAGAFAQFGVRFFIVPNPMYGSWQ
jgi:5'-nucleotidase (lipoprotein e(P4) family)